uniref:Uncharacterized protein n=1 Tax=Rhizophora mucronata TaxID=61149 RepID=A0A2P2Q320_RHIMU
MPKIPTLSSTRQLQTLSTIVSMPTVGQVTLSIADLAAALSATTSKYPLPIKSFTSFNFLATIFPKPQLD